MERFLLFFASILIPLGGYAQLTVKPTSGGSDSFVYVKDEILYVQEEINLTLNPTPQKEASIYLRDGGQLIQGGKGTGETSSNTGTGFLSVQRKVLNTNAWAYNDFASPVGNPAATEPMTIGNNKNFGINSIYLPQPWMDEAGISAKQISHTSAREGYVSSSQLTLSTRWIYTLKTPGTEAEGDYQRVNANNKVPAGFGFTMKGVSLNGPNPQPDEQNDTNIIYEFRGRPNSGDFPVPIGPDINGQTGKMTLSGNPYPSALDLNQVFYDSDNTALGAVWFYDEDRTVRSHFYSDKPFGYGTWVPNGEDTSDYHDNNPSGTYTAATFYIWNASGSHGPDTGSTGANNNQHKRYAPIGQGFRLVGNSDNTIYIKNKHRIFKKEGTGSVFQRPHQDSGTYTNETASREDTGASSIAQNRNRPSHVRLFAVFDNAYTRDMVLNFFPTATDGYDRGYDGISPGGMKSDAYFPIEIEGQRKPFVINATNYHIEKKVPITFKLHKPSQITLYIADEAHTPYDRLYLYDSYEDTFWELNKETPLTFGLPGGVYDRRFSLVFKKPRIEDIVWPKGALDSFTANVGLFQNNPAHRLEVYNPEGFNIKSVSIYDMSGKLVASEDDLGTNTNYSLYTGHLSDGVYLVKLLGEDNMPLDYKAIIMNK